MTTTKKHIIWSSDIDIEDYEDYLAEEFADVEDETEKYNICYEENMENLDCDRMNLDMELGAEIIAIADLGLWNGRRQAYNDKIGTNLADCLSFNHTCGDYITWYVDERGDLCCDDIHHDGTNHYIYRVFKPSISEGQKENFKNTLWMGLADRKDITRYTARLGDKVANIFGWK